MKSPVRREGCWGRLWHRPRCKLLRISSVSPPLFNDSNMRMKEFRCIFLLVSLVIGAASARTNPFRGMSGFISKVTKKLSDKRATGLTSNDLPRSERHVQINSKDSDHSFHSVISEMRAELDVLKGQACSELELDVRGSEYLDRIGEFYYKEFLNRCAQYTHHRQYTVLRDEFVQECTEACEELTSGFPEISYTGTISELQADIDNYIDQIPADQILSVSQTGTLATFRNSIWYARSKWVLAQMLMLALNFGQYELHRRLSIRAAEKRLAEVPGFPLL